MDTNAFASLAHLRILLLPVGDISHSSFERCAAEIRTFEQIRLGDIPADLKDERARFMPSQLSTGHLHLSFPTHPPPASHAQLSLIRPSEFPLAVIGVAACADTDVLSTILDQFNSHLNDIFPLGSTYPLAKNCFVFAEGDGSTTLDLGDALPGLVVIPSMMGDRNSKLYIGTLLADLCSHILGEFGVVVQTLESPFGNECLNSSLLPMLPALSDMPVSLDKKAKRDSLPPLPSHNSQPELGGKPGLSLALGPSMRKNMSTGPGARQSTLMVPAQTKKRLSGIGASSSHGRLFKVLADFHLLSGGTEAALLWYAEAMALLKLPVEAVWYASALEGMATATLLDAWAAGHGLHTSISTQTPAEPWAPISDKLGQATALYYKAPAPSDAEHYPLLAYMYCSAVLRHASLHFAIWSAKGWGPLAFTTMLQPGPTPYLPPTLSREEPSTWILLERLSSFSRISRSSIAAMIAHAHGPWLLHLGARERISILETVAGLYGCLGFKRKEAYILREILGCILDLLVCGREEDGYPSRATVQPLSGLGIQGFNLPTTPATASRGNLGIRLNESAEGNDSILRLLKHVCKVIGIDLDAVRLISTDSPATLADAGISPPSDAAASRDDYDKDSGDITLETRRWPELQVGVVREAVAVAEALPDYPAVAQFALSALKTMQMVLSKGDQYHLYSTAARALMTAQRRGDPKLVEYWSGRPINNITVSPLPIIRLPVEKPRSILATKLSDINPVLPGARDPFLYNPRKLQAAMSNPLVVQNEILEFGVLLQNPYVFDLELQALNLSTSGVPFESKPSQVLIPANSYHSVTISGKATQPGTLTIRGCTVQAPGGATREFIVPIPSAAEDERLARKRSALACESGRFKYPGLDSRPWEQPAKRDSVPAPSTSSSSQLPPFKFLECKVVPEQPLLRIRRTSLTHGAVMLYDGETSVIRITLENVSSLPIDFLRLAFDDSTIIPAQQALSEGELSVFDTYETEFDLIHRPMFSWSSTKDVKEVASGQKVTITVTCFGKVGCTSGTIHVSYSYVDRPLAAAEQSPEVFHTRQLSYPVMVTVYHMLECHGMDMLPFSELDVSSLRQYDDNSGRSQARRSILHVGDEAGWCLFSVEVRNTYGLPFDVTFERTQEGVPPATVTSTVPPGSTTRIVLPLKKFLLSEEQVSAMIPTLSERQFVVTKSNLTSAEEKGQRELFWYREELFKSVRGWWQETGGVRTGNLSLRQQRMTQPMLETLRTESARVEMSLVRYLDDDGDTEEAILHHGDKYMPPPNEFIYLRVKVMNLSASPLVLVVNVQTEPSEYIIHDGVLSDQPIGRLQPGEKGQTETALCFLAYGRFEISAQVRILGGETGIKAGFGQLTAAVREEANAADK